MSLAFSFLQYKCHPPGKDVCYFNLRHLQACPIILDCVLVYIWNISSAFLASKYITLVPLELCLMISHAAEESSLMG